MYLSCIKVISEREPVPRRSVGEKQKSNYPRRRLYQRIFGQGFDSPRIHQTKKVSITHLFCLAYNSEGSRTGLEVNTVRGTVEPTLTEPAGERRPPRIHQKSSEFFPRIFYPSRRLGISSPQGVYHHALACISSPKVYSSAT